jgi:hypothetical protein
MEGESQENWAMNDNVKWWFCSGGLFKIVGDVAQPACRKGSSYLLLTLLLISGNHYLRF